MSTNIRRLGLEYLPVELLYEIQLYAVSPDLPHVCRHLHRVYKFAPSSFHAEYITSRIALTSAPGGPISRLLRFPLCTKEVLATLARNSDNFAHIGDPTPELPRRLFRALRPKSKAAGAEWTERDHPLPFLRCIYEVTAGIAPPNPNAYEGYALTRAVHAGFRPLIRYLLEYGASPAHKNGLAVLVAIRQKDLPLVRMLIERDPGSIGEVANKGKRRKMEDRVVVSAGMLRVAVKCDARGVVEYLTKEKGCVPDLATLRMAMR